MMQKATVASRKRAEIYHLRRLRLLMRYLVLSLVAVLTTFPFVAMILASFAPETAGGLASQLFSCRLTLEHYREAVVGSPIIRWMSNSFAYAVVSVVLVLIFASMAGYAFAKKRFPGRDVIFWSFLAMLMVPFQAVLIPQYILMVRLGGGSTLWGLILPTLASAQGVFLMRQYIMGIPDELLEAAVVDGASELVIYARIILPLCAPVLATLGGFVFLWHWNDFLWPLVLSQKRSSWTLTVGLASLESLNPVMGVTMAAAVMNFLPSLLVFVFLQRYLVQGIVTTGLKE